MRKLKRERNGKEKAAWGPDKSTARDAKRKDGLTDASQVDWAAHTKVMNQIGDAFVKAMKEV